MKRLKRLPIRFLRSFVKILQENAIGKSLICTFNKKIHNKKSLPSGIIELLLEPTTEYST